MENNKFINAGEVLDLLGIWRGASFADPIPHGLWRARQRSTPNEYPMVTRIPASQRTREGLTALIEGRLSAASAKDG